MAFLGLGLQVFGSRRADLARILGPGKERRIHGVASDPLSLIQEHESHVAGRVSAEFEQQNLITRIEPVYPAKAKRAHVQGVVRLTVAIGKAGHVLEIRSVRGHRLLVAAARDAVRQWVYRSLLLGGEPIEVVTEVDVNFSLPKN